MSQRQIHVILPIAKLVHMDPNAAPPHP